ncbi:hypothetical protein EV356DRAFT_323763 [Viridothelium virens]|uniref:Uncharacterized protein n=1 Tax=Viridothelium virens TaxID=1048519 RepID=A0A6A6GY49_VIRVR|nr:hypothetical protein EV356DRAFT_323763 [Viridothelium virens]
MTQSQIPTYHLAPRFSIAPPPIGPIKLGSIVKALQTLEVINDDCYHEIPSEKIFSFHKDGFTATRSRMRRRQFGIWSTFVGILGFPAELRWSMEKEEEDEYKFEGEDTIYFNPTTEYIKASMNEINVSEWIEGANFKPVYIITGLKIARGPSFNLMKKNKSETAGQLGIQQPAELPLNIVPNFGSATEEKVREGWKHSNDFIVGVQVKKLVYKRGWFTNRPGELKTSHYNQGAQLLGDSEADIGDLSEEILEVSLDKELEGKKEMLDTNNEPLISWIVPAENTEYSN